MNAVLKPNPIPRVQPKQSVAKKPCKAHPWRNSAPPNPERTRGETLLPDRRFCLLRRY